VGENADRVQQRLRDALSEKIEARWRTEYDVSGTPVDVAGIDDGRLVLIELEWRRADPADNTAKVFRHASEESGVDDERDTRVFQVFTRYYQLADGGVSSKRKNAEFVGEVAAESLEGFGYVALTLGFEPPKRGGGMPEGWRSKVDEVAEET